MLFSFKYVFFKFEMIFLSFLYIYKTSKPKNLHSLTATCEATSDKMVGQPNVPQIKELFKSHER